MTSRAVAVTWVFVVGLGGCGEVDAPDQTDEPTINAGEPCSWAHAVCMDEDTVLRCVDHVWTPDSCASYCPSLGPGVSAGMCRVELDAGEPEQLCACTPADDGCYPGQGACVDEDTISWCAGDWTWATSSCADECGALGQLSLGCSEGGDAAACMCTLLGTPCDADVDAPTCADASAVVACEGAQWALVDCGQDCGGGGACVPGAVDEGAGCVCEP